jgi:hypothetical protein
MRTSTKMLAVTIVSLMALLVCSGQAFSAEKYSGFLGEYPQFEADKDRKGALIYWAPGVEIKNYSKIMIHPIEIFIAPDSEYKGINPADLMSTTYSFEKAIIGALEPDYPVVDKPGPGVMEIRIAITNVYATKAKKGMFRSVKLADGALEAEMLDSITGARLGALVEQYSANPERKEKDETSWSAVKKVLIFYATRFRGKLDKAHGRPPKATDFEDAEDALSSGVSICA